MLEENESAAVAAAISEIVLNNPPAADYKPGQWEHAGEQSAVANTGLELRLQPVVAVKPVKSRRLVWAAAASVLVLVGAATYFLISKKQEIRTVADSKPAVVQPGRQGALLTLADGSQVLLDTIQNGVVALQ